MSINSDLKIVGFDLLGQDGKDGLRFAWEYRHGKAYVESAAFPQRSVRSIDNICGYTTSVSSGCVLRSFGAQCSFCRTGTILPFNGFLSYRDIAKQNVFMVLADMYCNSHPELRNRPREFAYMGQGEPGFSYVQIRQAIELTNRAMKELGQTVHRHIFATCGVPEAIEAYKEDICNYYTQRVTLHFSLHETIERDSLMPINCRYSYKDVLKAINPISDLVDEKPCVGIMLFNQFKPKNGQSIHSSTLEHVKTILSELDSEKTRLSFCEYNPSDDVCSAEIYDAEEAKEILKYAQTSGFEAKLFSSFGQREQTACGMLGGKKPDNAASEKWKYLERQTDVLIDSLS